MMFYVLVLCGRSRSPAPRIDFPSVEWRRCRRRGGERGGEDGVSLVAMMTSTAAL